MPLEIDLPVAGGRPASRAGGAPLVIGLINNMPDSAVAGTERQFGALLAAAAHAHNVRLRFSSLPEISRNAQLAQRIESRYWPLTTLLQEPLDALIVTGTEPRAAHLQEEPYWSRLVELLDYADRTLPTSIWSCLAAHAAVLALDGIARHRLADKRSGVFEHVVDPDSPLVRDVRGALLTPHSRWNDLDGALLRGAGYDLVSASTTNGVDLFTRRQRSLLVFFQGHPEYESETLLKEYRRDVGRFLAGELAAYPSPPENYLGDAALAALAEFGERARSGRTAPPLDEFPYAVALAGVRNRWVNPAVRVYRNWLDWLAAARDDRGL